MEKLGRIFVGVPPSDAARAALAERVGEVAIPGKVVAPENWHVTLRFLGWIDPVTYDRFIHELTPISETASFKIRLNRFGAFPNPRRATVVWVGLDRGEDELARLNDIAEMAAMTVGLAAEERPYRPHLTLARVRPPADVRALDEEPLDIGWRCDRVVVYRSHLGRGGARYEPLETFSLIR